MPEGPLGFPRLSNIGPLTRETEEEVKQRWDECPDSGKPKEICESYKFHSLTILESQGVLADFCTLSEINSGKCGRVAEQVYNEVNGDDPDVRVIMAGDGDHIWINYKGNHYDAEVPTGVNDWRKLPFFERIPPDAILRFARQAAEAEGREPPETIEDAIRDVTDAEIVRNREKL